VNTHDHQSERILPHESDHERAVRRRLAAPAGQRPHPRGRTGRDNLALYLRRQPFTDLLSLDALYRMILDVPGVIMEFGVHRAPPPHHLTALRGVDEPHNPHRRIIGFDTFTGTLQAIRPYLTKGCVLAFDELAHAKWPGETAAQRDTIGVDHGHLCSQAGDTDLPAMGRVERISQRWLPLPVVLRGWPG
jgi:hypothetical protein